MSHNSSHGNYPQQPSAAKPFKVPIVAPLNLPVDYSGFIAVVFGIAGVMFRYKLSSWLAICFGTSLARGLPFYSVSNHWFAIMGLVTSYFGPARPAFQK